MAGIDFRLPGTDRPLNGPEAWITGVLRNFQETTKTLGFAIDRLVLRIAPKSGQDPDYQIQTADGEDAAAYSGETHELLHDDITVHIEEKDLSDQSFTAEQVKDWLNVINGEGTPGGQIDPILSDSWTEGDVSDSRG
ncbi:hypothetical protein SAMN05216548_10883 [Faunimonas pinastri]|uniref:Uncharacterized protein n=1 Tax=Faunimonas pinastri TaxID=1855383 RepID=A0A1H9JDF9_9HYPH|nr:hypothetical protein [Faunimonas pinastri]SEQ84862.1 hypothetical protein SAMN05216548_10883 [Faunimonas pinastri]